MKTKVDQHRRDMQLQVDDNVYLKFCPFQMYSLAKQPNEKLSPMFFGPYRITHWIGEVAYKLDLSLGAHIHPVFHISQLCKALGPPDLVQPLPAGLTETRELLVQPTKITTFRPTSRGLEVLTYWKDLSNHETTWELCHSPLQPISGLSA